MTQPTALAERLSSRAAAFNRTLQDTSDGVILYGAGFIGRWSVRYFRELGIPVVGIVDSNPAKTGLSIDGVLIQRLSDLSAKDMRRIVISSRHNVTEIQRVLACHFIESVLSVDEFVVHKTGTDLIYQGAERFKDLVSKETYFSILNCMATGTTDWLRDLANSQPYFGEFGYFNRTSEVFVDAGAYTGDSIERFIWSVNGSFTEIHGFEPGAAQYEALQIRLARLRSEWAIGDDQIIANNFALSAFDRSLSRVRSDTLTGDTYESHSADASTADASLLTNARSLDSYFGSKDITLLKADVEGHETELITGGSTLLQRCLPRLILAVYHFPTDLFSIPRAVETISPHYRYRLRHHSSQLMETFLYCSAETAGVRE